MHQQVLCGTPDDIRPTVEDLARDQDYHEYLMGNLVP
jgi:hypothetical protein